MYALKSISVVCISIPDAHKYLADSYRPYQDRNNRLAATYDGAHGQDAKARDAVSYTHLTLPTTPYV